jgi:hypothetical protein
MQRQKSLSVIIGLLILSVITVQYLAASPTPAGPPAQEENLLKNPGFEGRFQTWNGISEIQTAANWTPWWWENSEHDPPYFRPEFKRAEAAFYPNRVLSGESAQQWFTFHASHVAGMYQQVFNARPGQLYRFTIWTQVWSSLEDNPYSSVFPANPHLQVGIDPTGFWNAGSPDIIWSAEAPMSGVIDQWGQVSVEGRAQDNIITVFMRTRPEFANKHNDMYWDNAALVAISSSPPTPYPPTNTVDSDSELRQATNTLTAENTPIATRSTPEITASSASSTSSKTPSPTHSPSATDTPKVTKTPKPTQTLSHTATAVPTESAQATATPTFTPIATSAGSVVMGQYTPDPRVITTRSTKSPGPDIQQEENRKANDRDANSNVVFLFVIGLAIAIGYVVISRIVRRNRAG